MASYIGVSRFDLIVVGLGGMGSAAAEHAASRGKRVLGLERGDDLEWMRVFWCQLRQQPAAERHPAHERAQQDGDGDRRGADDELDEIEPDGFVNERRAAAAREQEEEKRTSDRKAHGFDRIG